MNRLNFSSCMMVMIAEMGLNGKVGDCLGIRSRKLLINVNEWPNLRNSACIIRVVVVKEY